MHSAKQIIPAVALVLVGLAAVAYTVIPEPSSSFGGQAEQQEQQAQVNRSQVGIDHFFSMLSEDRLEFQAALVEIDRNWNTSYLPMMLEVGRFLPRTEQAAVFAVLEKRTGNDFGLDHNQWLQWMWQQDFEPHPGYGLFKTALYQNIDPRFAEYFAVTENATIRLDEIRWGGVRRDGIPPLKNPKMLAASDAGYLADSDVVFGIELNDDARCYPKRILAWHEMFKDTIGGESVCGVY